MLLSAESPRYRRIISYSDVFLLKTIVSIKFKSAENSCNQKTFEGMSCKGEFGFRCCLTKSLELFSTKIKTSMFPCMSIPFEFDQDLLIKEIRNFARSMRKITHRCYNVLPFKLEIIKEVKIPNSELEAWNSWYDEKMLADPNFENDYKRAISRPRTHEEFLYEISDLAFKAADESCIEQLKIVIIDESNLKSPCPICLEELHLGSKATCLPCSHAFHGDCVVQWLEVSHMCPLCRYELPVD
ncbi:hypothetical protein ACH5RR_009625 [Cinchona calisaya]|uniref:RING-type E3 ubiquitin transferase n=1 Tax=Cinchona calisaya TaxID=153742 RepID=A0ABD3AGP4_9GENT